MIMESIGNITGMGRRWKCSMASSVSKIRMGAILLMGKRLIRGGMRLGKINRVKESSLIRMGSRWSRIHRAISSDTINMDFR